MTGCIFNIQRFSVHDGPGIRTNVFLKGCPLRCIWCHNPEGLKREPQIRFSPEKCIGCGDCKSVCNGTAHKFENNFHMFDFDVCEGCMTCPKYCPADALEADGEIRDVDFVINEVLKDLDYYKTSGGGLTLSGGEPFYQPEFAIEILRTAKSMGIHTAVETCGMVPSSVMEAASPFVDVFLYDYKATGEEEHKRFTGASQKQILENLRLLEKLGSNVILRCPIVPGINDNEKHYMGIADTATNNLAIKEINIMPYHSFGIGKGIKVGVKTAFSAETMSYDTAEKIKIEIERYANKPVKVI